MPTTSEYHVTIDFQSDSPDLSSPYKLIGLETDQPIMQIDHQIYVGTWATPVGTDMIFDESGEWCLNVEKRLIMQKVEIMARSESRPKSAREMLIRQEDVENGTQMRTTEVREGDVGPASEPSGRAGDQDADFDEEDVLNVEHAETTRENLIRRSSSGTGGAGQVEDEDEQNAMEIDTETVGRPSRQRRTAE